MEQQKALNELIKVNDEVIMTMNEDGSATIWWKSR